MLAARGPAGAAAAAAMRQLSDPCWCLVVHGHARVRGQGVCAAILWVCGGPCRGHAQTRPQRGTHTHARRAFLRRRMRTVRHVSSLVTFGVRVLTNPIDIDLTRKRSLLSTSGHNHEFISGFIVMTGGQRRRYVALRSYTSAGINSSLPPPPSRVATKRYESLIRPSGFLIRKPSKTYVT